MTTIGRSIRVKGHIEGDENLVIDGRVEGRVMLEEHHVTIGPNGYVRGEVAAKLISVVGTVVVNVVASERIDVQNAGVIDGDLSAPRLVVAKGAVINGSVSMKDRAAVASVRELEVGPSSRPPAPSPL